MMIHFLSVCKSMPCRIVCAESGLFRMSNIATRRGEASLKQKQQGLPLKATLWKNVFYKGLFSSKIAYDFWERQLYINGKILYCKSINMQPPQVMCIPGQTLAKCFHAMFRNSPSSDWIYSRSPTQPL